MGRIVLVDKEGQRVQQAVAKPPAGTPAFIAIDVSRSKQTPRISAGGPTERQMLSRIMAVSIFLRA
jgi:hypothetical protein